MRGTIGWALALWACSLAGLPAAPAFGQDNRYWLLEGTPAPPDQHCSAGQDCAGDRVFTAHPIPPDTEATLRPVLDFLLDRARTKAADPDPGMAPRICAADQGPGSIGFDVEAAPPAHRLAALRGLDVVGLDLTKTRSPPGEGPDFAARLQLAFAARLQAAGLQVVSPAEAQAQPGRPVLNVYFSFTDPEGACDYRYSIFASLSQTVLLTRRIETKLAVGVWSHVAKTPTQAAAGTEFTSLIAVADAFVTDRAEADSR